MTRFTKLFSISPNSANQCILGDVYLRSNLSRKLLSRLEIPLPFQPSHLLATVSSSGNRLMSHIRLTARPWRLAGCTSRSGFRMSLAGSYHTTCGKPPCARLVVFIYFDFRSQRSCLTLFCWCAGASVFGCCRIIDLSLPARRALFIERQRIARQVGPFCTATT